MRAEAAARMAAAGIAVQHLEAEWVLDGENVIWGDGDAILPPKDPSPRLSPYPPSPTS